ncbi:MAG: nicotinate-nucleotide adenylyltransferase [Pikeienuella sp.]
MQGGPQVAQGMRIGVLGGSFDPAHDGHVHISREALKRFRLDVVWWMLSPGNPLKQRGPAAMARRVEAAQAVAPPSVVVTDIEARLGGRFTADTLDALHHRYPAARFVWLMGADNLAQLHRWRDWQRIVESTPIGVLPRPGWGARAGLSPAARTYKAWRIRDAAALAGAQAPVWAMAGGPTSPASSTAIRKRGEW